MSLQAVMSSQERMEAARWADAENRRLSNEIAQRSADPNQGLGRDDFLKILITQLSHQDPTQPMQDREFIAQMAQFSSLEQMTNMAADFSRMARLLQITDASTALGKSVEIATEDGLIQGIVDAVTREDIPHVRVNGSFYSWEHVSLLYDEN